MPSCLFCRKPDRPFTSREHPIPQGLGNQTPDGKNEIVLDRGVVCDMWNNGVLAQLDHALLDFMPISLMRTFNGVLSKSGQLPSTKLNNAKIRMVAPGHIRLEPIGKTAFKKTGENSFDLRLLSNRKVTPKQCRAVTRALFKMTLGCMYIDQPSVALSERFHPVRRMTLGEEDFHGYVTVVTRAERFSQSHPSAGLYYDFLENEGVEPTVWTRFDFYRFSLFTDLETRRPQESRLYRGDKAEILEF